MFNLRLYIRMVRAGYRVLGLKQALVGGIGIPFLSVFSHSTLLLDRIFFPKLRKIKVVRPVFIIGHPRSGTTFIHRLLTQTHEFATFKLWELLCPSLTARAVLEPLVRRAFETYMKVFRDEHAMFSEGGHDTDLDAVEEEELLFTHRFDTQMDTFLTPLAFDEADWPELVFCDEQPEGHRMKSMRFFHACLKRQLYATGKGQVLAKLPYSTLRLRTLLKSFPDARIVYLVRSPLDVIPSHLSLHRSYFDNRWGLDKIPPDVMARYYRRRYQHNVDLYRYFHQLAESGALPPEQVKVIRYDAFVADLENAFRELVRFAGIQVSDALVARVKEQAGKQTEYTSRHKNLELEEFGLTREQVLGDLKFVFDEYGFPSGRDEPEP